VDFSSKTSGDIDGVNIYLKSNETPSTITISGSLGGYVKVGNPLSGNPHKPQPSFNIEATWEEVSTVSDGKYVDIRGGAGLFVRIEAVPDLNLPRRVKGTLSLPPNSQESRSVYLVGREWSSEKVITSPLFINYK
jgi:hypothetical protein